MIIRTEDQFIERLISIADNFKWQIVGGSICAFKKEELYDPITAYIKISRGIYVARHSTKEMRIHSRMMPQVFENLLSALYSESHSDLKNKIMKVLELR